MIRKSTQERMLRKEDLDKEEGEKNKKEYR